MEALMGVDLFPPSRPVHEIIEENGGAARSISAKPARPVLAQANLGKIVSFGRYRMAA
jgi:hypothetical protein